MENPALTESLPSAAGRSPNGTLASTRRKRRREKKVKAIVDVTKLEEKVELSFNDIQKHAEQGNDVEVNEQKVEKKRKRIRESLVTFENSQKSHELLNEKHTQAQEVDDGMDQGGKLMPDSGVIDDNQSLTRMNKKRRMDNSPFSDERSDSDRTERNDLMEIQSEEPKFGSPMKTENKTEEFYHKNSEKVVINNTDTNGGTYTGQRSPPSDNNLLLDTSPRTCKTLNRRSKRKVKNQYNCDHCHREFPSKLTLFNHKRFSLCLKVETSISDSQPPEKSSTQTEALDRSKSPDMVLPVPKSKTPTNLRPSRSTNSGMGCSENVGICDAIKIENQNRYSYKCYRCPESFQYLFSLTNHLKYRHRELGDIDKISKRPPKQVVRLVPKESPKKPESVQSETSSTETTTESNENFVCKFCSKTFDHEFRLKKHLHLIHRGEKPFVCMYCKKRFTLKSSLKVHLTTHSGERPHECSVCLRRFRRREHYQVHSRIHLGLMPFQCRKCGKKFRRVSALHLHQKSSNDCNLANNSSKNLKLLSPVKSNSKKEIPIPKSVDSRKKPKIVNSFLTAFKKVENSKMSKVCQYCKTGFSSLSEIEQHLSTHSEPNLFLCTLCQETFPNLKNFISHQNLKHLNQKVYSCNDCKYASQIRSQLERHLITHTNENEKPFKCNLCPLSFNYKTALITHQRSHSGDQPFKCSYCSQKFSHSGNRNRHEGRFHLKKLREKRKRETGKVSSVSKKNLESDNCNENEKVVITTVEETKEPKFNEKLKGTTTYFVDSLPEGTTEEKMKKKEVLLKEWNNFLRVFKTTFHNFEG